MGKWHTYHLTLHPGERDPERVAAELRGELPAALLTAARDSFDLEDILARETPDVWVDGGLVHFSTGRNWRVLTFDWGQKLVPALSVPARWACGVWQQEVEYNGGVEVFGWVDGGFVPVDDQHGQFGTGGADALRVLEREWGVTGSMERDVPQEFRADGDDPVTDPETPPAFEPVDREALGDPEAALAVLADPDRGAEARRRAAERLYVHVTEREASVGLDPRLFAALDDEATRWAAGATVRELSVSAADVRAALAADDPARRRAGARFCLYRAFDPMVDSNPPPVFPVDALTDALSDPDAEVRRTAARALERSVVVQHADPPTAAFDALAEATTDDDPGVRGPATFALVRSAFDFEEGDFEAVADAFARAVFDEAPPVRDRLDAYLGPDLCEFDYQPDSLMAALTAALARAEAERDADVPEWIAEKVAYAAHVPEYVEPVLPEVLELGYERDSPLARAVVESYVDAADESHDRGRRLTRALDAAGIDPDHAALPEIPEPLDEEPAADPPWEADAEPEDPDADADPEDPDDDPDSTDEVAGDRPSDERSGERRSAADSPADDGSSGSSGLLDWLPF